jgi:hypothetical protein
MKFVIRDDDLNYFSKPADIEGWYKDIFEQDIPVGFATIPFVKGTSDVYKESDEDREFPISQNRELCEYIKSNKLIEIVQHGCNHVSKEGTFEYAQKINLVPDTLRGKSELERAFSQNIKVFASPHDWINTQGVVAIEMGGMDIIRGRGAGLRNWIWRWQYAYVFIRMLVYRFPKYISTAPRVFPYILNFGKHKETCSYRLEDSDIFDGLNYVKVSDGIFVVTVHVHTLNKEKKIKLLKLIETARKLGAEFVPPSRLFS